MNIEMFLFEYVMSFYFILICIFLNYDLFSFQYTQFMNES